MAAKKVKVPAAWNAKPVTQRGGGSGGVRKPTKPYSKPPAKPTAEKPARWDTKASPQGSTPRPAAKPNSRTSAPASNTRPGGAVTMPNSARAGVNLPKAGARAERTATRVQQLKAQPTPAKTPAQAKATAGKGGMVRNAKAVLTKAGRKLDRAIDRVGPGPRTNSGALVRATAATALTMYGAHLAEKAANPKEWERVQKELKQRREASNAGQASRPNAKPQSTGTSSGRTGRGGTTADQAPKLTPKPQTKAKPARVADYKDAQGNTYDGNSGRLKQAKQIQSPSPAPTRSGSASSGGSAPSAPRSSSAPVRRPSPAPAVSKQTGDKAKDMETWRKANPTLAKSLDERHAKKQSGSALKISNQFDTKSDVYSPSTKVDGSKLDTSKIDQKKVDEYKRRKDRYYS